MANQKTTIFQTFLRRLTNLSGNNRSLLLLRLHAEQLMDVHLASQLNGERSFSIINALIAGREKKICAVLDSRIEANNDVSGRLKKLQRADQFLFEERGSKDLHVGWPFLRGKFIDGTPVRCPLLFFPVTIQVVSGHWTIKLRDAGITLNKAFLLAYAYYNNIKLDEELLDATFEDFSTDSTVFRTEVYQLLKDKLEINFNADNFRDELQNFEEFKKDDFDQHHGTGEIKLYPEAVIGIFPQAGSQLEPDYHTLIEQNAYPSLEHLFFRKASAEQSTSQILREERVYTPFSTDAYQDEAIRAIKHGNSIVVQGPPGTGKSQLIANLMADAVATGRRVLLVCQKRAALDVVHARLKGVGLGDFMGLVHDFRNDRNIIYQQIARQIDRMEDYKAQNRSIDSIQLERRFVQVSRSIDHLIEELDEFKQALYDDRECGLSVKELYLTSDLHGATINIRQEYQNFHFSDVHEFVRKLKVYCNYASWFSGDEYPWRERKSFATHQLGDRKNIEILLEEIPQYIDRVTKHVGLLLKNKISFEICEKLAQRESEIMGAVTVLHDDETFAYFQAMMGESDDETSLLWLTNMERVILNCFNDAGIESTLSADQLGQAQHALQQRTEARRNLLRRARWELFSENKYLIKRMLVANNLEYTRDGLHMLEGRLDNRLNFEHQLTALKQKSWLGGIPTTLSYRDFTSWFEKQKLALRAKLAYSSIIEIKGMIDIQQQTRNEFGSLLRGLVDAVKDVFDKRHAWLQYLTPYQVRVITQQPSLIKAYVELLRRDFDNLCDYDKLIESLMSYEQDVINRVYDNLHAWDAARAEQLFQNSLRLAWIDHLETKHPILRAVSSMKMESIQSELPQLVHEKQKLSKEILLLRARERVTENIEYNRLNNRVTYRDLHHQVAKKKKVWPIRRLLHEFEDEVFNLVPCWLVSPESASALFALREIADLVIFDEASQCFSERGIPAMVRGKQILVAGDSQQLKPSELYQIRWEDDGDHPDEEVESLLGLATRYLSTIHLQGHYRSRRQELIDFSNEHFYQGRLRLLPDRSTLNHVEPGIEYRRVDGRWENQTNAIEANAVVDHVFGLIQHQPDKEIGVVTFNSPQQNLILDLLEAGAIEKEITLPPSLFVKNIENVQGDERDIIIFSVAYAPDKQNTMTMQFGSLNQAGGENRLNVAVTRAREKVVIFTSILPDQLAVDDAKNTGPRILREYLRYAWNVSKGQFKPYVTQNTQQRDTWFLNSRLKRWGETKFNTLQFHTDGLPYGDLHFKTSHHHLGMILTDDQRYADSLSAKETYAYTQAMMTEKNWPYKMIFSRQYWQDPVKLEEELMRFIASHHQ